LGPYVLQELHTLKVGKEKCGQKGSREKNRLTPWGRPRNKDRTRGEKGRGMTEKPESAGSSFTWLRTAGGKNRGLKMKKEKHTGTYRMHTKTEKREET